MFTVSTPYNATPSQYDMSVREESFPTREEAIAHATPLSTIRDERGRIVWQFGKRVDPPLPPTR